ncbi:hypothetical protein [Streptomyces coerulescens]|uniref:Uncharacterized protein n=1 Tax=Streptomyces coerulescens TaxID=29304 RepID=A0ABW0CP66_STRCD
MTAAPDVKPALEGAALLPVPRLSTLTEHQVRGITCVWNSAPLHPHNAIDLGARHTRRAGKPVAWYPRGCRPCVAAAALAQITVHAASCRSCQHETVDPCETAIALNRLFREYPR